MEKLLRNNAPKYPIYYRITHAKKKQSPLSLHVDAYVTVSNENAPFALRLYGVIRHFFFSFASIFFLYECVGNIILAENWRN